MILILLQFSTLKYIAVSVLDTTYTHIIDSLSDFRSISVNSKVSMLSEIIINIEVCVAVEVMFAAVISVDTEI